MILRNSGATNPARALRSSRQAMKLQPERCPSAAELAPRPNRSVLRTPESQGIDARAEKPGTTVGLVLALKSALDRLAVKAFGSVGGARVNQESPNLKKIEEVLGFEIGNRPPRLRTKLLELGESWIVAKERQDAAILDCDLRAFGEAQQESNAISEQIIELLQSFNANEADLRRL
jgi:hypothetical protein